MYKCKTTKRLKSLVGKIEKSQTKFSKQLERGEDRQIRWINKTTTTTMQTLEKGVGRMGKKR